MSWLAAVVAALCVLTVFNTLLCFAVIRRLRGAGPVAPAAMPADLDGPAAGTVLGGFETVSTDGEPLTAADVAASALVLFLSPGCGPCRDVAASLAGRPDLADQVVVAFVLGEGDEARAFAARLPAYVRAAYVEHGGPVPAAFGGIGGYPTLLRVRDGVVVANEPSLDGLAPVPAAR
jgi:hypothetical protein